MTPGNAFLKEHLERQKAKGFDSDGTTEIFRQLVEAAVRAEAVPQISGKAPQICGAFSDDPQQKSTSQKCTFAAHEEVKFQSRKALAERAFEEFKKRLVSPKCVPPARNEAEFQSRKAQAEKHFAEVVLPGHRPAYADKATTRQSECEVAQPAAFVSPNSRESLQTETCSPNLTPLSQPFPASLPSLALSSTAPWPMGYSMSADLAPSKLTPTAPGAAMRTVQDFTAERTNTRPQTRRENATGALFNHLGALISTRAPTESWSRGVPASPGLPTERATHRAQFVQPPAPAVVFHPVDSLTACLNSADCPATARHIFRVLFSLGLESVRARGVPVRPDVAVFHLPVELLAAHIQRDRTTVWRNLKTLLAAGVLAAVDHYGSLRGQTALTGKVWAISLCPERILSGHAVPVKVTMSDLRFPWRDLDKDARQGRTAYALTRTEDRQAADKAQRKAKRAENVIAQARAEERRLARVQARADGKVVPHSRAAATLNAAKTRAEKSQTVRLPFTVQQSVKGLKVVERGELERWVLAAFSSPTSDVTLTVAPAFSDALDAVFTLPMLTGLSRSQRGELVEKTARTLAAAFEDSQNLRFWCWLIWQTLRAHDQGQDWSDDVAHLMARVLHDLQQDQQMGHRAQNRPAALVVNGLRNCELLDALRQIAPTRVGKRPQAA